MEEVKERAVESEDKKLKKSKRSVEMEMDTGIYYFNNSNSFEESNVNDSMLEYLNRTVLAEANTTESPYVPYEQRLATYVIPIIFALIFIIGVLGNGCLILIFFRHRAMVI